MKKNYGLIMLIILFILTGCNSSSGTVDTDSSAATTKLSIHGLGVDVKNGTVCIDINQNRVCDKGEASTQTNEYGEFSFSNIMVDGDYALLLLVGGIDMATNKPFLGEYKRILEIKDFESDETIVLNVVTDLVAISFINLSDETRTLTKIKEDVATQFTISISDINKDPMKDILLFVKYQTAEQLKNILSLSIFKELNTNQANIPIKEIIHQVAKSYAYEIRRNPNESLKPILTQMMISLETKYGIEIPQNEKTFIFAQLIEIIKVILEVQNNSDITIAQLPKVKNGLELLLNTAYYAIERDKIPANGIPLSLETIIKASDADDIKTLQNLAEHLYGRTAIDNINGAKATYNPIKKKVATSLRQEYIVHVSLSKRDASLTTDFTEIVEADKTLKNQEDLALIKSISTQITSRNIDDIALFNAKVEFTKQKIPTENPQIYTVIVTITKGNQKVTTTFDERIEANNNSLDTNQSTVIEIANQINSRTLPNDIKGTTISFLPSGKKSANSVNQSYTVLVDIVKGDAKITTSFIERVDSNGIEVTDDLADVNEMLSKITGRVLPISTKGVTITFDPSQPKRSTREEQIYDVTVIVSKGEVSKSKTFSETISIITTYEEDTLTITNLKGKITSRDLSNLSTVEKQGVTITFEPLYQVTKEASYNSDVTVTITKGAATTTTTFSETIPASNVYVAFSGGGWHSHTTLAGWLMGAMDAMDREATDSGDLINLTKNIDALSCNSGGCWFATQLTFSETFASKLETQSNEEYLGADGYLGKTRDIFEKELSYIPLFPNYLKTATTTAYWSNFMEKSAFKPFGMVSDLANTTLASQHLEWARAMPLIYSVSLNTNTFVTSDDGWIDYKTYYQAGINGTNEWLDNQNFTPVSLTSLGNSASTSSPVFLEGDIKLQYAYNSSSYPWISSSKVIPQRHPSSSIKVFDAASSSSAAGGASANFLYNLSESAIGFEITDNGFEHYYDDGNMDESYQDTANKRRIRFSDGGYVDNTSVAFMVKHLQENNKKDNFKIVLFMNSSSLATSNIQVNKLQIPQSAAILFGKGYNIPVANNGTVAFDLGVKRIAVPSADIFTAESWDTGKIYWSRKLNGTILQYVKFDVETKDNAKFGIKSGDKGELHLFIGTMDASHAMPGDYTSKKGISQVLDTYEVMLKETRKAVTEENGSWRYLKEALNL